MEALTHAGLRLAALALVCMLATIRPLWADDQKPLNGIALVIGQQDYEHLGKLTNPGNDAREIQKLLTDLGFEARLATDRDSRRLGRELERFVEDAEGADVALLYYSGHGIEAGGENFLVPVDASTDSLDDAEDKLVPLSGIVAKLKATVPVAIVLLDACRSNPFPAGASVRLESGGQPVAINGGGLGAPRGAVALSAQSKPDAGLGTVLGFAAEPGRVALDGPPGGNSPYAAALIRHLSAMQGNEFGMVLRMVAEEVYLKTGGRQQPWVNESLRRLLYFGMPDETPTGTDGEILTERRKLLLTISTLPSGERGRVEAVAASNGVPMDALYGMLRALGSEVPSDPAKLDEILEGQAEKIKALMDERAALKSTDPEIVRLSALADQAVSEGALETAIKLHEQAKTRVAALEGEVSQAEADVKARRIEFAEVYAKSAAAYQLAFDYLTAARDFEKAFRQVERWDDALAFQYRHSEALSLFRHGDFKGDNAALMESVDTFRDALRFTERNSVDWALAQNNLGVTLRELGDRQRGNEMIEQALAAHRAALEYYTRERAPEDWGWTQMNIANVLATLGARETGTDKLDQAVAAYRAALEERTRERDGIQWARTQQNLGSALWLLGTRKRDPQTLRDSVAAFHNAMEEFTRDREPLEWANTESNLGASLRQLGEILEDDAYLEQAAQAYRAALEVRTRESVPLEWATTQNNLGNTLSSLAKRRKSADLFDQAFEAYRLSLLERSRERVPLDWAQTQYNVGYALQDYASLFANDDAYKSAITAYATATLEWTEQARPQDWASAMLNIGTCNRRLGETTGDVSWFDQSANAWRALIKHYDRATQAQDWASNQADLAYTLLLKGQKTVDAPTLQEALAAYDAATEVFSPDDKPLAWANAKYNSAVILDKLAAGQDVGKLRQAVGFYRDALVVYARDKSKPDWLATLSNIGLLQQQIGARENTAQAWQEAVDTFRAVVSAYSREVSPSEWSQASFNLGYSLQQLGYASGDVAPHKQAIEAFRAVAGVEKADDADGNYGPAEFNIGLSLQTVADAENDLDLWRQSVDAFAASQRAYKREKSPEGWGSAEYNRAYALAVIGSRSGDLDMLRQAAAGYREAAAAQGSSPLGRAQSQRALGDVLMAIGEKAEAPLSDYEQAVAAYRDSLDVYTRQDQPSDFVWAKNGMGYAQTLLGEAQKKPEPFADAVKTLREAVDVARTSVPDYLPFVSDSLCRALTGLGTYARDRNALDEAEPICQRALDAFKAAGNSENAEETGRNLANLRKQREALR